MNRPKTPFRKSMGTLSRPPAASDDTVESQTRNRGVLARRLSAHSLNFNVSARFVALSGA